VVCEAGTVAEEKVEHPIASLDSYKRQDINIYGTQIVDLAA
jgi:hypothetical protein